MSKCVGDAFETMRKELSVLKSLIVGFMILVMILTLGLSLKASPELMIQGIVAPLVVASLVFVFISFVIIRMFCLLTSSDVALLKLVKECMGEENGGSKESDSG